MPDFDEFLDALKGEIVDLVQEHGEAVRDAAMQDSEAFLRATEDDLRRWTRRMARDELSEEDVAWLIKGRKDLAEMEALKQAGLAAAQVDRFRNALIDRIVDTTLRVFL